MLNRRSILAAATATLACSAVRAAPPSNAEQAIDYRMAVYTVIAWNVGEMAGAVQGKAPYQKDTFAARAARVATLAPMLPEGFPTGSYVAGKTEAKPEIWQHRAEFDALLKKLADKSTTLAEIAKSGDLAQIKPAFTELTQVCKSCHDKFKTKDD